MQTATANQMSTMAREAPGWIGRQIEAIDRMGRGAWIALTIAGFVLGGPLGLIIGGFALFSGRMSRGACNGRGTEWRARRGMRMSSSGNGAFDSYRDETLRRLEDEQRNFQDFLERLREAKDKAEFDQFMDERATAARDAGSSDDGKDAA